MIIKIKFEYESESDYIYCPDGFMINMNKFFEWIYGDKEHRFWVYDELGERLGVEYRSDAVVEWINNNIKLSIEDKSYIIDTFSNKNREYDLQIEL